MGERWVIIWASVFDKQEGVVPEIYYIKRFAEIERDRFNLSDPRKRYHVVEFGSEEHLRALQSERRA